MTDSALAELARLWPPEAATLRTLFSRQRLQRGRSLQAQIIEIQRSPTGANARVRGAAGESFELALQGVLDRDGQPHYSALCSCRSRRFCEHAAAVLLSLQAEADAPRREQALQLWVAAMQRRAPRSELQRLPPLEAADAARLMDLLQQPPVEARWHPAAQRQSRPRPSKPCRPSSSRA